MLTTAEKTRTRPLHVRDCGLIHYREILQSQHELREKRYKAEIPNTVLIAEHPPVITLGARQSANKLLIPRSTLADKNIDVVEIRRGGGATAHNPGQLVFYPILNLQQLGLGISEYIRKLEQIGIELLTQLGITAQRRKGLPGLWVRKCEDQRQIRDTRYEIRDTRKIASIGVRVSKFITYHGMAINIQNDMSIFDSLIPCGLDGVEMTSVLAETGKHHLMSLVKEKLSQLLIRHLSPGDTQYAISSYAKSPTLHSYGDGAASEDRRDTQHEIRDTRYEIRKLAPWLRRPLPASDTFRQTGEFLASLGLETICTNANCPNQGDCWDRGAAAVLILGNICTRNCKFCSVPAGKPHLPDPTEPARIAEMAGKMQTKYLVITSVNRDDLPDGGAGHFRDCIKTVRHRCPNVKFEILTPDFHNCQEKAIEILRDALPFVFAHNLETVPSLYPTVRPGADYQRSLNLLKLAKDTYDSIQTKSSIMLGLGETDDEVQQVLRDLQNVGCDRITIGQYLKPSKNSLEVVEYISPENFDLWKQKAASLGFSQVFSAPFARSSYSPQQ